MNAVACIKMVSLCIQDTCMPFFRERTESAFTHVVKTRAELLWVVSKSSVRLKVGSEKRLEIKFCVSLSISCGHYLSLVQIVLE